MLHFEVAVCPQVHFALHPVFGQEQNKILIFIKLETHSYILYEMKRAVSILIEGSVMNNATRPNAQFVHDILKHGILRQFVQLQIEERK